ncbi:hypothetical protein A3Q56_00855 [Intoshia linei]|uniref:CYRIA/CYRIB Rac1 binding domain-containing protein n=1 Tax=Intoshia linei TaxID=1819745 RepID=A0A177BCN9_9BILA|nr:hypothetical protein A3Q56_00855 [Intoshia linei]
MGLLSSCFKVKSNDMDLFEDWKWFINFEDKEYSSLDPQELNLYNEFYDHIGKLKDYVSGEDILKKAYSVASEEVELKKNMLKIQYCLNILKKMYFIQKRLKDYISTTLEKFDETINIDNLVDDMSNKVRLFVGILYLAFEYDILQTYETRLTNELSFYSRYKNIGNISAKNVIFIDMQFDITKDSKIIIIPEINLSDDDLLMVRTLISSVNPMFKEVKQSCETIEKKNGTLSHNIGNIINLLQASVINFKRNMKSPEDTINYVISCQVILIILVDNICTTGVFSPNNNFKTTITIKLIKQNYTKDKIVMLSSLKYFTRSLNSKKTPESTRKLLNI